MTAFSNGTEWDCWAANWCYRCTKEETCDIWLDAMMENEVPDEWTIISPNGLGDRYSCSEFEPLPPAKNSGQPTIKAKVYFPPGFR